MNSSLSSEFSAPSRVTAFIDNAPLAARNGHVLPVVNPADERTVSELEESDATVVDRAVRMLNRKGDVQELWPE